jgi:hypothetical protein
VREGIEDSDISTARCWCRDVLIHPSEDRKRTASVCHGSKLRCNIGISEEVIILGIAAALIPAALLACYARSI